jgi:hypothetical protein
MTYKTLGPYTMCRRSVDSRLCMSQIREYCLVLLRHLLQVTQDSDVVKLECLTSVAIHSGSNHYLAIHCSSEGGINVRVRLHNFK